MSVPSDDDFRVALVVLRALQGGREPYAPSVYPTAKDVAALREKHDTELVDVSREQIRVIVGVVEGLLRGDR